MSSKASTHLDRYLQEKHTVCEDRLSMETIALPRDNTEQAVAEQAVTELDKYMETATDHDLLPVARQAQKGM
jgi:hypothetical protein